MYNSNSFRVKNQACRVSPFSDEMMDVQNYGPPTIMPHFAKLFECILSEDIYLDVLNALVWSAEVCKIYNHKFVEVYIIRGVSYGQYQIE